MSTPNSFEALRARIQTATAEELKKALPALLKLRAKKLRSEPLAFYTPHDRQEPFHRSLRRERWCIGSNRSGKTQVGSIEDDYFALGEHPFREVPKNTDGWVVSETYQVQIAPNGIQDKILRYLPAHRIAKKVAREKQALDRIILTCNRCGGMPHVGDVRAVCSKCGLYVSTIGFKTYDQDRVVFQAAELDWIHLDEEPPEHILNECRARLSKSTGGWLWATMTPVEGMTYTYDQIAMKFEAIKDDPNRDLDVFSFSMYDNPYLTRDFIEKFKASIADPAEVDIRVYGKYATLSGLVYKAWESKLNEVAELPKEFLTGEPGHRKIHPDFRTWVGIDTGNNFAAAWILVDYLGNLWVFDEMEVSRGIISKCAAAINGKNREWGITPQYIIDRSTQFEYEFPQYGIYPTNSLGYEDWQGIAIVQNFVIARQTKGDHPRLIVCRDRCPGFLRQRARYQWDKPSKTGPSAGEPKNKPRKVDDHILDAARYVIENRPSPSVPSPGRDSRSLHQRTVDKVKKEIKEKGEDSEDRLIYEGV